VVLLQHTRIVMQRSAASAGAQWAVGLLASGQSPARCSIRLASICFRMQSVDAVGVVADGLNVS